MQQILEMQIENEELIKNLKVMMKLIREMLREILSYFGVFMQLIKEMLRENMKTKN